MGVQPHLYRSPRYLRCLHSFCKDCLENAGVPGEEEQSNKKTISCPTCSTTTQVYTAETMPLNLRLARESKGAAVLAKIHSKERIACEKCIIPDTAQWFCLGCSQFICHDCESVHQKWRELVDHKRVTFEELSKLDVMSLQPTRPIRCSGDQYISEAVRLHGVEHRIKCYKCKSCRSGEDACQEIITKGEENKREIGNRLEMVINAIKEIDEFIQKNREMQDRLKKNAKQAKITITEAFNAVDGDQQLSVTKDAVNADMDSIVTGKQTRLCLECEKMEKLRDHFFSKQTMVKEFLAKYTDEEVMCAANAFCSTLDEIMTQYKSSLPLHIGETDFLKVIVDHSKNPFCRVSGGSCPETSIIITQQVSRGIVYTSRILVVEARDESGYPYGMGGEEVTAKIYSYNDKQWYNCSVSDRENGQYEVRAAPDYCGNYDLHVNIRQQPIKGSPFNIYARRKRSYYDTNISTDSIGLEIRPGSVAPGDCEIFVCEYSGKSIYVIGLAWYRYGGDGVRHKISVEGAKQLQGIAVLNNKILLVTDGEKNEVVKLTTSGEVIARFGETGSKDGQFKRPTGIAVDGEGRIYVGEFYNNRVQIFNADFSHHLTIPLEDQVQGIALDTSCNIHVTQQSRGHIKVFSRTGEYIRTYGMNNLREPRELYIDEEDYCLVTDRSYEPVKVFNSSGEFLRSFGAGLQSAQGVCITPYGLHGPFFYVCDRDKQQWVRY